MDEGDDYVPQISQLEPDGPGGYPFASDLSSDAYVPPPPGPNAGQSQSVYAMQQQQQHQPPPHFYHNQPQQGVMGAGTFAPPPPQPMPPPAPAKSKSKKKKPQQQQQVVQEQPLPPPPQHFAQPQQQQSPYPAQAGHSQWNAYTPRPPYMGGDQLQLQQQQQQQQHYSQQQVNYPSAYNGGYPEQQQQQQMPQANFYQQRPAQPSSYYPGQQQHPRMPYPGYPQNPMQQQPQPQQQQPQQQHYYPQQPQQQQQQPQPASHYGGHGYPNPNAQPAQRFSQPWPQQQQQQQQPQPQQYPQNAGYPGNHQYPQQMAQQMGAPRPTGPPVTSQWQQLQMEMQRWQGELQMLSQQPQTPQVQQQAQNAHQRMHYLRSQMQSMQQQQQQQQQSPAAAPPMTSPVHLQQQQQPPYGGQNAPPYMQQQQQPTSAPIPSQVDQQQQHQLLSASARPGMTPTSHSLQKSPLTPPPPPPAPPMMASNAPHSQPASTMHSPATRPPMNTPHTDLADCSTTTVSSSMSVMQRGPEVQVNIKPEAQSTTLISVYQYPGAPPNGPHHGHQQASLAIQPLPADNHNFVVPPEPEPPAPKQPIVALPPTPVITELKSPPRKPPVAASRSPKSPKATVLSPPPFAPASPTPLIEEPPSATPVEEEPEPVEEKVTKPKARRRPAKKAKTKKEKEPPPPLTPPVVEQEESSAMEPAATEVEPAEPTDAATPAAAMDITDTDADASRLSIDSVESVESEAPKRSKKKAAPKKASTESKAKPKQKFPTKKSSKPRKRKRLSYESEVSGDEAAKVADEVAAIVDEIPESLVEKRRSSRVTKRRRYEDSENFPDLSDEEHLLPTKDETPMEMEAARLEDQMVVEKIMLMRTLKKANDATANGAPDNEEAEETPEEPQLEEFYCKFKNFSYLHCAWKSQEELEKGDKRVIQKIKRFKQRREQATTILDEQYDEDEPFNPDYIQVERVLDVVVTEVPIEEEVAPIAEKINGEKSGDEEKDSAEDKSSDDADAAKEGESDAKMDTSDAKEDSVDAKEEAKDVKEESKDAKEESKDAKKESKDTKKAKDAKAKRAKPTVPAADDEEGKEKEDEDEDKDDCAETKPIKSPAPPATKTQTHYLVKWRSLQYEDSTWELEKDVDKDKIAEFEARRYPKPDRTKDKPRPQGSDWRKMDDNPVFKNDNQLREYQVEGLDWLLFCWYNRQNCILADEMGLGKTIQTITFLCKVQEAGVMGPFLVVAPLSTIHNWEREFETWSDINAVVYHGTSASRQMIRDYEMYFHDDKGVRVKKPYKFDALITTFEMVLADCDELKEIPFRMCVIDEAHRLKNRNCKLLTGGFSAFQMEHRVLLTGTPLQNNIDELFSLLNFLEPKQFASSEAFLSEFGQCKTDEQVNKLQEILKPMMLRRLKEDVEKALKPKEETIIEVELSNIQKKYYRAILERNFSYLCKGASAPSLMNTMMELRKCCNHPFLINGAEEQILAEQRTTHPSTDPDELAHTALVQSSGKLVLIDKLLPKLRQDGHKVLVFSQMVRVLDLIEEYLIHMKYPMERIDGNVRGDLRQAAIDRFSKPDSDRFVFLLCTRAGGLGINLTAADTVIIFDSDWNPQNDLQAQARCHRIGQQKSVKIYRLITRNTYEREMFDKASLKLGLDKAVLQSMGTKDNMAAQLSKKEVEELLRKGAYGAVMSENNEDSKFSEEDIDTILQRRTQTITVQAGVKGSTFAKASFNVSSNREDIDVNDPNFWAKWAKRAGVDPDFNPDKELILYEPRQRKRRFDEEVYKNMEEEDSDSDSDDSQKQGKKRMSKRRRGVDGDATYTPDELAFNKTDYFKVEKNLSVFGWGRWKEIRENCDFKQTLTDDDIEHMCRTLLLHCVREFSGDEKIREFAWELITPLDAEIVQPDANAQRRKKTPAKSGSRKSSRIQNKDDEEENDLNTIYHQGWAALPAFNPPALAVDCSYQRHLQRHANKVLLRIRLLYFLTHEVIGALGQKVVSGTPATELDLVVPWHPELPVDWWDQEADKSLLIGIYKHGFENFAAMRDDPALCFLKRCGHSDFFDSEPPAKDKDENEQEANESDRNADEPDEKKQPDETPQEVTGNGEIEKPKKDKKKETTEEKTASKEEKEASKEEKTPSKEGKTASKEAAKEAETEAAESSSSSTTAEKKPVNPDLLPFPSTSELNARFRRLMTLYQRSSKLSSLREEQKAKAQLQRSARQVHIQTLLQEREVRRLEERQRWTRREETDFYRTLSMYGVVQDPDTAEYRWDTFKKLARLESKFDQTLTDYATAFLAMCKRMCRRPLSGVEESLSWIPESVSEERANKVLQRVEFLNRVRAAVRHPRLLDRIQLCKRTPDLPPWWEAGVPHDLDLLKGVAEHGLYKTEEHILHDPKLSFAAIYRTIKKELAAERAVTRSAARTAGADDDLPADAEESVKGETAGDEAKADEAKTDDAKPDEDKTENAKADDAKTENAKPDDAKTNDAKAKTEPADADGSTNEKVKKQPDEKAADVVDDDAKEPKTNATPASGASKPKQELTDAADLTVAQILAEQSGNMLQWPKERMIIFRLQNVCMTIEQGEWPATISARGLGSASSDVDQRSTPDDTPRETPSLFDESRDSPLTAMFGGGRALTPKSRRSRKPKNAMMQQANPLQDLMEAEKEKMRALMHQSFLQQIEQFPFAAAMAASGFGQPQLAGLGLPGFPTANQIQELGLASLFGLPSASTSAATPSGSSSNAAASSSNSKAAASSSAAGDEALNLSTKHKKNDQSAQQKASASKKQQQQQQQQQQMDDGGLPLQEMLALANLPADSRMAVINLKDGSRLTGKEAPTLRSLAQWLSAHPDYVLDLPRSDIIHDLEPGEIPKPKEKVVKSADKSAEQHVSVVNRKNPQLTLNGSKGPTLKNLPIWLEKNPDWDIDPSSVSLVKSKVKLPDKLKSRLRQPETPKSAASKTPATPTAPPTSTAQSSASFDPFAGLFPTGLDAATQLQMQMMMMQNPFANPSLLGMGLGGFPGAFPFPGMMSNSMGMNGMAGLSSPTTSTNANTPTTTTTNNSSSRAADSEKKSSSKESKRASAKESSSSSSALASAADKKDPLADNPFLAAMGMAGLANSNAGSSAGGIFGMNPFMAGGMQPGMSPNLALAQLQSLIGMQGLDSLMAASFPGFPAVSSVGQTQSTPSRKTTTTTSSSGGGGGGGGGSSSKAIADSKGGKEKSGRSTSSSNSRSAGSNSKLNALVDKLAAAKGESPAPAKHDDDNNDDEGRK